MSFEEKQQLNLWWLYILLGIETIVIGSLLAFELPWQEVKNTYFAPIWAILLPYALVYAVNKSTFSLKVDHEGITYQYWPFSKRKILTWNQIDKAYLRKYDALGEYGGWGIKHKLWFKLKDKAYIFNDKTIGLQLNLPKDKKILFSIDKNEELNSLLTLLKQKYQIQAIETDVRER